MKKVGFALCLLLKNIKQFNDFFYSEHTYATQ